MYNPETRERKPNLAPTANREPRTANREPRTQPRVCEIPRAVLQTTNREPRTANRELNREFFPPYLLHVANREPRTVNREPRICEKAPRGLAPEDLKAEDVDAELDMRVDIDDLDFVGDHARPPTHARPTPEPPRRGHPTSRRQSR